MQQIGICDDEKTILEEISEKLESLCHFEYEIKKYEDGESLLADSRRQLFDVLFLDIDMPGLNGMELAERIREDNQYVKIIFVTNKDNLVYKTLKYAPFRYIRKSHLDEEFPETAEALQKALTESNITMVFSAKDREICKKLRDVIYVEVLNHTMTVHVHDGDFQTTRTLDSFEKETAHLGFIRVHNSYLVNYRYISEIKGLNAVLNTGNSIPISRKRIKDVKLQLQKFSRNR